MSVSVLETCNDLAEVPEQDSGIRNSVTVDQVVRCLSGAAEATWKQPLSSLNSHNWYSIENYRHVVKWCAAAASVVSNSGKRGSSAQETVRFLVAAIVDRYNYDRALYAASHLPDYPVPAPKRFHDVPLQINHRHRVYHRHTQSLSSPMDVPPEAIDRVAAIATHTVPDKWDLVTYEEREVYDP